MSAAKKTVIGKKPASLQGPKPTTVVKPSRAYPKPRPSSSADEPEPQDTQLDTLLETQPDTQPETQPDTQPETQPETQLDAPRHPLGHVADCTETEVEGEDESFWLGWVDESSQAKKKQKLETPSSSSNNEQHKDDQGAQPSAMAPKELVKKADDLEKDEKKNSRWNQLWDEEGNPRDLVKEAEDPEDEKDEKDEEGEELESTQLEATSLATRWSLDAQA